jgi:hypothetical protein
MDWIFELQKNSALVEIERYEAYADNAYWSAILSIHSTSSIYKNFVEFLSTDKEFCESLPDILYDAQMTNLKVDYPVRLYQFSSLKIDDASFSELLSVLLGKKPLTEYRLDYRANQVMVSMISSHQRVGCLSPKQFPYAWKVLKSRFSQRMTK